MSDLINNPTPRTPVVLILDTSGSMADLIEYNNESKPKIDFLNEGFKKFVHSIQKDDFASASVELTIITFQSGRPKIICNFISPEDMPSPYTLKWQDKYQLFASGGTPFGSAIELGLKELENRKEKYKKHGISYHQPWLVAMTDMDLIDDDDNVIYEKVAKITKEMSQNKKLFCLPISIVSEDFENNSYIMNLFEHFQKMTTLDLKENPIILNSTQLNFEQFFTWLSSSLSSVSVGKIQDGILSEEELLKQMKEKDWDFNQSWEQL